MFENVVLNLLSVCEPTFKIGYFCSGRPTKLRTPGAKKSVTACDRNGHVIYELSQSSYMEFGPVGPLNQNSWPSKYTPILTFIAEIAVTMLHFPTTKQFYVSSSERNRAPFLYAVQPTGSNTTVSSLS